MRPRVLLALAFVSGVCGLAYEVLYSRLLTTYLGDMLQVSAAILATFLVGLGIGSFGAHRWYRWLWAIEALIGIYAVAVALVFAGVPFATIARMLPEGASQPLVAVSIVSALVAVPSLLIGCSVPLFAAYLHEANEEGDRSDEFARVYVYYNLGAGLCVLGLEFWLLRSIGLRDSMLVIAFVNLCTALALRLGGGEAYAERPQRAASPFGAGIERPLLVLFVVAALSAAYQLLMLRVVGTFFGPWHENFALLLWLVMTGLALGSNIARSRGLTLSSLLFVGAPIVIFSAAFLVDEVRLWTHVSDGLAEDGALRTAAKALIMTVMALPAFTIFGATVPAYLHERGGGLEAPGRALGVASLGNCFGFLVTLLVLFSRVDALQLMTIVGLGTLACGALLIRRVTPNRVALVALAIGCAWLMSARWPQSYFVFGHARFLSPDALEKAEAEFASVETTRRFDADVSIVTTRQGVEYVTINGYSSMSVASNGQRNHREVLVGIAPALYPRQRDKALVLGTGTGVTAGAVSMVFDHTTTVEINPAVYAALPRFAEYNFGLHERKNVDRRLDDGLTMLARSDERYDLVLSTVTSPLYFASSKLYAREFFELVKEHLTPDGVFVFWFDSAISKEGADVILETVARSFVDCHFVYLSADYYATVCGTAPLAPRPLGQWPAEIETALARWTHGTTVDGLLDALVMPAVGLSEKRWGARENTFDLPQLEHIMARAAPEHKQTLDFDTRVGLSLSRSPFRTRPPTRQELALRCHLLARVGRRSVPKECRARFSRKAMFAVWHPVYVALAADYLEQTGRSVIPFEQVVVGLLEMQQSERALALLDRKPDKLSEMLAALRLDLTLTVRGRVDSREVRDASARFPMSFVLRRVMVRQAMMEGRERDAYDHIRMLGTLGILDRRERVWLRELKKRLVGGDR